MEKSPCLRSMACLETSGCFQEQLEPYQGGEMEQRMFVSSSSGICGSQDLLHKVGEGPLR